MKIATQVCHRSVATTRQGSAKLSRARSSKMVSSGLTGTLRSGVAVLGALLLLGAASGCQNKETPPPLPTAKPPATASTVVLTPPEDEDAGAVKKPVKKGTGSPGGLAACCKALRQNAASAPPETQGHMLNAAAACDAANATGVGKAVFGGQLSGLLRGAGMPPACK